MRETLRKRTHRKEEKWADQAQLELEKRQKDKLDTGMITWESTSRTTGLEKHGFSYFYNVTFQSLKMKCECVTDKQEKQWGQGREFSICVGPMPALNYILYLILG